MNDKSFLIVHNQDPNNLHYSTKKPLKPEHVDAMIDNIADSGVDAVLINSNAEVANHPSSVIGTYEDMFNGEPAPTPDCDVPESFWDIFANDWRQYVSLKNARCDYLARALARSRKRGLVPGISVRMNDMHGGACEKAPCHGPFFKNHPDCRIMLDEYCLGLNYAKKEVRNLMLNYVRELAANYEFELLELDWLRFHTHFYPGERFEKRNLITDFMAEIRTVLAATGKQITLMARIHQNPAAALENGLDIAAWAKNRLVDIIVPSSFYSLRLDVPVEQYRNIAGDGVKIFACLDDTDKTGESMLIHSELARGAIAAVNASGAQGLEFFNQFFAADKNDPKIRLRRELLNGMKSSAGFKGLSKHYRVEEKPSCFVISADTPWQLPVEICRDNSKVFTLLMAKPDEKLSNVIEVVFEKGITELRRWHFDVNDFPVGQPASITDIDKTSKRMIFSVPSKLFNAGTNFLHLRYTDENPAIIYSIHVKCIPVK
jgi:hypothetical protein